MSVVSALPAGSPASLHPDRRASRARTAGATPHPFAKAFACAAVAYGLATAVLLGAAGADATAVARALGVFAVAAFVPALITGMMMCQSSRVWPFWRIALVFLPMFSLVAALHATGTTAA